MFGGANPLPQVVTIARVGAAFNYSVAASTSTGGSWLTVTTGNGCGFCAAPSPIIATVNPSVALAAGSYTGQIVATSQSGTVTLTIPVTLIIATAGTAFVDNLQGQMSFSLKTGRTTATSQDIQVRNGGSGTLNWTLTKSTSDGANWLTVSSTSGAAPSLITVGITVANLPGGGITTGTFIGQLVFSGAGTTVTVPVSVVVGDPILTQVNPISFTKVFGGPDPLSQVLTIASTGTAFNYFISTASTTGTGGAWLAATTNNGCGFCVTPSMVTATINASPTLPVGTYTGQIVIIPQAGFMAITIPVTLTVAPAGGTFLDNFTGQMSFSVVTAGTSITSQDIQIRNAGTGTLSWTATGSTSDGGNWLTISAPSGTAPAFVTIGVTVANLPSGGLIAGTFVGELVFQTTGSAVTVPISVTVGINIFSQVNSISFTKVFGGANPLPQIITIPSIGTNFNYFITSSTATGGAWLSATTSTGCGFCVTPSTVSAKIVASPTLPVGTYTGEIIVTSQAGTLGMTISVTLNVLPAGTAYFDNVPGLLSFTLKTGGSNNPPSQLLQIRNGGTGTLGWTVNPTTSDTGNWLNVSALSGTAPSNLNISISRGNLPGGGLIPGTFVGNLEFQSAGSSVTVSISVVVGDNIFSQVNPISFIKVFGGANPLPQTVTIASIGTNFNYFITSATATGGSWLTAATATGCGFCVTPSTVTATINAAPTLPVGTYTGEIVVVSQAGTLAITVPVTLTVVAASTTYFDDLPGQVSFSFVTGSGNPTTQDLQIRNPGIGSLGWTVTPSTADGGNWLTVTPGLSGTAPSIATIGVTVANLPSLGLVAGTFTGQLLFQSASANVTIPVSVTVGANVFAQLSGITFTKAYGGSNPVSQILNIASTATNFNFFMNSASANGGAWLTATTVGGCGFCATPHGVTAAITASPTLPAGTYTGQIVTTLQTGLEAMTIPVYLNVSVALSSPALIAPADLATNIALSQNLSWAASTNALSYDVYFGTTNPPSFVVNTAGTSYAPASLASGTTYYWQIVARNGAVTASSAVFSFQTTSAGGAQPISVTPASGSAGRQLFSFVARDTLGANSIQYVQFLFSKAGISALNACYISYDPTANVFYLLSDDLTQWYGLLGGSPNTIGNAQCTIYGATSGSNKVGTDLTTNVDISFRSGFAGLKTVYQFSGDTSANLSGWISMGTWNDTGDPSAVELVSLSPNSGTGVSQTFTAVTKDGDGATTIPFVQLVMNAGLSGFNGCFIHYDRASNVFFLLDDLGTVFSGLVAGSAGQVSNSQCTLHGVGSGGTAVGSNLTVTYNLDFSAGFAGTKQIFMQAVDNTGVIEVWHQMGTWTR